jgi:DNA-binding CsgD family transcriptional regulator
MKPITPQEKKVLELIGDGYSTPQIAYALAISTHTVESHRKNLLLKLNAKNAAELIRNAIQVKAISLHYND